VPTSGPSDAEAAPQSRRGLLLAVLGLTVSGVLLLVAARLQLSPQQGSQPAEVDTETGASLLLAMGWLLLAAVAALFATTGPVRRIVGVVICGAGITAAAVLGRAIAGGEEGWALWIATGLIASGLAVATGVGVARWGGRWPGWSRRFDSARGTARKSSPADPVDQWRALDRGEDPTR